MGLSLSFRFVDDDLNDKLISLVKKAGVRHVVDNDGVLRYSPDDEEIVEDELISSIRSQVFAAWQVLTCPSDWVEQYRQYMTQHSIPFHEEQIDDERWFLIPRKYRPNLWKFAEKKTKPRVAITH